ncbi:MAG: ATP-binding protein [Candidatus Sulfotelmatobacter sp.]
MTLTAQWQDTNQAALCRELDRVYAAVLRLCGGTGNGDATHASDHAGNPESELPEGPGEVSTLDCIARFFGLSSFERDVLVLCTGTELESRFGVACAEAQKDPRLESPTFSLALAALPDAHFSALRPNGPLRYWRLVEVGTSLLRSPMKIDERILHYIAGVDCRDERLEGLVQPLPFDGEPISTAHTDCARKVVTYWQVASSAGQPVILAGHRRSDRRSVTQGVCQLLHCRGLVMRAADIPLGGVERHHLARLCDREALLTRAVLCVEAIDLEALELGRLTAFLSQIQVPVVVEIQDGSAMEHLRGFRVHIPRAETAGRKAMWLEALGEDVPRVNGSLDRVAEFFDLDRPSIQLAGEMLRADPIDGDLGAAAWKICRSLSRRALDGLAQRIEPKSTWDDLILPDLQKEALKQIAAHVRQRARVHGEWGFAGRYSRGMGVAALFAGSSGTGKTMAAEVIAGVLELDLYQIDLAGVVSKYIGETEKNLRRIFDAAEETGAVLLFDEADALFGKRSEIRDSHDRYANLEISYLLQRVEAYRGLAILTTNMKQALDPAFLRRMRFMVQFPFPDLAQRSQIWESVFPKQAPLAALDFARISQLQIPGGLIRNIATHAAFLAAEEGSEIKAGHILNAARVEYAKHDRPLTPAETAGWA